MIENEMSVTARQLTSLSTIAYKEHGTSSDFDVFHRLEGGDYH